MELNTFFRICVYLSILMLIFTLSINFIASLSIFSSSIAIQQFNLNNTNFNDILSSITMFEGGINYIWLFLLSVFGIGSFGIARMYGSTSIVGIYLFSAVFWTSYMRCLGLISLAINFVPIELITIITTGIGFIWIAAIIGMLSYIS